MLGPVLKKQLCGPSSIPILVFLDPTKLDAAYTFTSAAVVNNRLNLLKFLVEEKEADVNEEVFGKSLLQFSFELKLYSISSYLIRKGADCKCIVIGDQRESLKRHREDDEERDGKRVKR